MTVLRDPGNITSYSYSDGQPRMWKDTAGLWEADAMDPNNTGTYAWSLASQLWRLTAQTWKSRADTAYDSGTWGSGSTWHTDYTNALAPVSVDHQSASGASARHDFAFGLQTVATITFDRTGQWLVVARNDMTDTSFGLNAHGKTHVIVNGVDVASSDMSMGNGTWTGPRLETYWQGSATSGQTASVQIASEDASSGARNATGYIDAYFIPTQANPH